MRRLLAILVLCTFTSSCVKEQGFAVRLSNNSNPLTALHADATSTRYENDYWERQKNINGIVWKRAIEFCSTHDEYTNCYAVNEVVGPKALRKYLARKKRKSKSKKKKHQPNTWAEVESSKNEDKNKTTSKDKAASESTSKDSQTVAKESKGESKDNSSKKNGTKIAVKNKTLRKKKISKTKRKKRQRKQAKHKKKRIKRSKKKKGGAKSAKKQQSVSTSSAVTTNN